LYTAFTDTDLAHPLGAIPPPGAAPEGGSGVALASRHLGARSAATTADGSPVARGRRVMSRSFNLLVRGLLLPGVSDTQAGLKGFRAGAAELVFERLTVDRFAFDVEAL